MTIVQRMGGRKLTLGMFYLTCGFACLGLALWKGVDAGVIASVAAAYTALAAGMATVVWGNVREWEAKNGSKP